MATTSEGLAKLSGAGFSGAKINLRIDSGLLLVARGYLRREVGGMFFADEIDGAASEAAPGHASATKARQALRGFDHDVEFLATNLVEIAQAGVRVAH